MTTRAWVLDCWDHDLGGYIAVDAPIGATTLELQNAGDLDPLGGVLEINGLLYEYAPGELDENTVTLVDPLTVAVTVDDYVRAWDAAYDSPQTVVKASVEVTGGDPTMPANALPVLVSQALADRIPRGGRGGARGETVLLEDYGSSYRVVDILAKRLNVDGGYIDPTTVPTNPALQLELDELTADLATLTTVTLPALELDLAENTTLLATLSEVTVPGLAWDLGAAEAAIAASQGSIDVLEGSLALVADDLTAAEADVTALEGRFPIQSADIGAAQVIATKIGASAVESAAIATGAVLEAKLAAAAVTVGKIADGAVGNTKIADGAVATIKIADGAILNAKLAANAVATGNILDDAINAAKIAAAAVGSGELATGAVIAGKIAAGTIVAADISAGAINTAQLNAGAVKAANIAAGAVIAGKIAANAVTATEIAAGSITANKLLVTMGGGNLQADSSFESSTAVGNWAASNATLLQDAVTYRPGFGVKSMKVTVTGALPYVYNWFIRPSVTVGRPYLLSAWLYSTAARTFDVQGITYTSGDGGVSSSTPVAVAVPANTWTRVVSNSVVAGATSSKIRVNIASNNGVNGDVFYVDDVQIEEGDVATAYSPKADEILPGTVIASMVAANTLTANEIAANAVTASELAANAVVAGKIAAGTIVAADIAAGQITTAKLAAGAVTANEIAAGAVIAGKIAAGAVTTRELTVGSVGDTLILNGNMGDLTAGAGSTPVGWASNGAPTIGSLQTGSMNWLSTSSGVGGGAVYQHLDTGRIRVHPDEQFYIEATGVGGGGVRNWAPSLYFYDRDDGWMGASNGATVATDGGGHGTRAGSVVTVPNNALIYYARVALTLMTNSATYLFRDVGVNRVNPSVRIADGAIIADKIAANAVVAAKIDALAVTTAKLAAGAVTAAKITAATITATEIAVGTITATQLAAGSVTATQLAAGSVTAADILAGTITAVEIAGATITAAKIAAGTITATQIATGTITALQIAAGTITATQIAAGTITTTQLNAGAINGMTITGAILQTAATGERLVLRNDGSGGVLEFFTGIGSETAPGTLDPFASSGLYPGIRVTSGTTTGQPTSATMAVQSGAGTGATDTSFASIRAGTIDLGRSGGGLGILRGDWTTSADNMYVQGSQVNSSVVTTNGSGVAYISYGSARGGWQSTPVPVISGGNGEFLTIAGTAFNSGGFYVTARYNNTLGLIVSGAIRVNWIAMRPHI